MKYTKKCECCWHKITAYTHNLSIPLVSALRQLVDHYERTKKFANLQKDLVLTKNQYNNFQKLQYFGLVHRESSWRIPTVKWRDFIYWDVKCYNLAATLWKDILGYNDYAWETHSVDPKLVHVKDIDEKMYKQKLDYQIEKWSEWLFSSV